MQRYNPKEIEARWQAKWEEDKTFKIDIRKSKKPYFNLMMFPYPSGEGLHVGHVYAFGGADTYGRFKSMQGYDVFEPMGFDSFGIHSENYAIKVKKHPKKVTDQTTKYFREKQLKKLGTLIDWDHEVITSNPEYYKWTQWVFIQLFKAGLAVRKKAPVDWCPSCKTVLANEQVIADKCERCNTQVVQKELNQWFFKITKYAQKLLDNFDNLPDGQAGIDWTETTKTMQKNWIGRSEGIHVSFKVKGRSKYIKVFTTRPDTIFGVTFLVLSPEHKLAQELSVAKFFEASKDYIAKAGTASTEERSKSKTGVFTGSYVINPFTKKEIPVWIADYVLLGYGTGAVMAVPAHDKRDYEFALGNNLPIVEVIKPNVHPRGGHRNEKVYDGEGSLVNSGRFNDLDSKKAIQKISEYIEKNKIGEKTVNYHLRDWLISRQRYWGPPIPMIHCENCQDKGKGLNKEMPGWFPVPDKDLPVELPYLEDYQPKGKGVSPLATLPDFVRVKCPECGNKARRETDVSDTFLDSAWYFLRYPTVGSTDQDKIAFDKEITKKWLPVENYIGGNEHAVLHLLYTRFITMALKDMGKIDFDEPFKKFRAHGLVIYEGAKMSKSRGNVVNPDEFIESYGADTLRVYLLFIGPYEQGGEFSDRAISGVYRFLSRIWYLVNEITEKEGKSNATLEKGINKIIKSVGEDFENLKFNTAIASLMEYLNLMYTNKSRVDRSILRRFLLLIAPLAPHLAEEMWSILGGKFSVHQQSWPLFEAKILEEDIVTIVLQINGRVRDQLEAHKGISKEEVGRLALDRPKIKSYTESRTVLKTIWVQGRLLNLVVGD